MITPNGKICWPLTEVGTLQLPFCDITVLLKNRVPGTKYCHFNFDPNIIIHCLQYYWPSGDHLMQTSKWSNLRNQYLKVYQETIIDKLAYYTLHKTQWITPFFIICFYLFIFQVYSLDGLLVLALLVVCTCAYITKVPRLKSFFLSEKKGFFGVFYKGKSMFLNKNK